MHTDTGSLAPQRPRVVILGAGFAGLAAARGLARSPVDFVLIDREIMATIGRGRAVAAIYGLHVTGLLAWILWGAIHVMPLVGFRNRLVVALDWFWTYLTRARGVRLITAAQEADTDL